MNATSLDTYAYKMLGVGFDIACRLRQEDPQDIYTSRLAASSRQDLVAMVFTLAAALDIEKPATELLAWMDEDPPIVESTPDDTHVRQPCGTPAAYARHRRRKEPICAPCRLAYNQAQNRRKAAA